MPADALTRLREGNTRFVADRPTQARTDSARIREQARQQTPFACVLACSDSRVPVEFVFDQGVGDLFVVRTAGNTAGEHEVASLTYAAAGLGVPLIVVMGHTNCGAIRAALGDGPEIPEFRPILDEIHLAHAHAHPPAPGEGLEQGLVDRVAKAHVEDVIAMILARSPTVAGRVKAGLCGVVGAIYDTRTGKVSFFDSDLDRPSPEVSVGGRAAQASAPGTGSGSRMGSAKGS